MEGGERGQGEGGKGGRGRGGGGGVQNTGLGDKRWGETWI